jgi:hypothetical protein
MSTKDNLGGQASKNMNILADRPITIPLIAGHSLHV